MESSYFKGVELHPGLISEKRESDFGESERSLSCRMFVCVSRAWQGQAEQSKTNSESGYTVGWKVPCWTAGCLSCELTDGSLAAVQLIDHPTIGRVQETPEAASLRQLHCTSFPLPTETT